MDDKLTFKDKCHLALYFIDKLEGYWKRLFYSTMTIIGALLGGAYTKLFYWPIIIIIGIMFIAFTLSNLSDHIRVYKFLMIVLDDIKSEKHKIRSMPLEEALMKLPYKIEIFLCKISYVSVSIGIILIALFLKKPDLIHVW